MGIKDKALNAMAKLVEHDAKPMGIGWPPCLNYLSYQPVRPCAKEQQEKNKALPDDVD